MGTLLRAEVSRLRAGQRPADGKPGDGEPAANGKVTLSPAHTAVRIRGALVRWIGWLRSRGPSTGPAGAWIGARKTPLRIAVVTPSACCVAWGEIDET